MSGEAGFTLTSDYYALFVGSGVDLSLATLPSHQIAKAQQQLADEEKRLRKKHELGARDVRGLLESLRDDGLPLLPFDGTLPLIVHPGVPTMKARFRIEGKPLAASLAAAGTERFMLDLVVERPLSDAAIRDLEAGVARILWPPPPPVRRVHHLSCLTMCPLGGALVHERKELCCHCLLVETEQGLVLVDTALGVDAVTKPPLHTSRIFLNVMRPRLDVERTAARQIVKLGYQLDDVKHVVLTHLDLDHAGGIPDFPGATVHVLADELEAARNPRSFFEKERYRQSLWAHDVKWQLHQTKGERWYGFECVRDLPGLPPEILLVPLRGHTQGHCGVAVDVGGRWLLHCGDAYFHKDEMDWLEPRASPGLAGFQRIIAVDEAARKKNQARLRELAHGVGDGVTLFCAHDPDDLDRVRAEQLPPA